MKTAEERATALVCVLENPGGTLTTFVCGRPVTSWEKEERQDALEEAALLRLALAGALLVHADEAVRAALAPGGRRAEP